MHWLLAADTATLHVPTWIWGTFLGSVILLLTLDLVLFHRKPHEVRTSEAIGWSCFWVGLALAFNGWIWWEYGKDHAIDFLTGYIVEESLSVDNLFVFLLLFAYFKVPPPLQHRVLFFGILGAIVFRLLFVWIGAELLHRFEWVIYIFGGFLVFTGAKLLFQKEEGADPSKGLAMRIVQRFVPFIPEFDGTHLTIRRDGKRYASLLLVVIIIVEMTDIVFAVDSVPAVFAVTREPFIVFTSNIAAILGLRSIYFLLARFMSAFRYLKPGLALILAFVGLKMVGLFKPGSALHVGAGLDKLTGGDRFAHFEVTSTGSLAVIGAILALATIASLLNPHVKEDPLVAPTPPDLKPGGPPHEPGDPPIAPKA